MGKFSGITICSDFDGTLAVKGHIVDKNIEAIRYFQENGGLFSVITGRTYDFLLSREAEVTCNTFVGCFNGAVIYDYPCGACVEERFVVGDVFSPIMQIYKEFAPMSKVSVFSAEGDVDIEKSAEDFEERLFKALSCPVYKVIIRTSLPYTDGELEHIRKILGDEFEQSRSWSVGLEIQNRGNNKGYAARRIAELSGSKRLICVGDYENDIPLLLAADTSYAVENALPELKRIANRQTVSVEEGAIAAIIRDLENEIGKENK